MDDIRKSVQKWKNSTRDRKKEGPSGWIGPQFFCIHPIAFEQVNRKIIPTPALRIEVGTYLHKSLIFLDIGKDSPLYPSFYIEFTVYKL